MAVAAVCHKLLSLSNSVVKVCGLVHGKNRGQLLMGKLLGDVHALHLADDDFGGLGHFHACQGGNGVGLLAYDFCVQGTVDDDGLANLLGFGFIEEIAAALLEVVFRLLINLVQHNNRLLGGADHAVVKGFGVDDGVYSQDNVGGIVDDSRGVARAHAQSGGAGGISGVYHAGAACCQDDVGFRHDLVGQLQGGRVDPAEEALRGACLDGGIQHNLCSLDGAFLCPGMGADDDAVAGL